MSVMRRQSHAAVVIERGGDLKRLNDDLKKTLRERSRLEAALRASHADLIRAQTVAGVGSWRLDVGRNVLEWSEATYRIFGVTPGTPMTYAAFLDCVHPNDRAYVDREWNGALRGLPYDIEHVSPQELALLLGARAAETDDVPLHRHPRSSTS